MKYPTSSFKTPLLLLRLGSAAINRKFGGSLSLGVLFTASLLLASSASAQTVRFKSPVSRLTVPLNFAGIVSFTNVAGVSGVTNPVDLSVSGAPAGVTAVSITDTNGNPLPVDGGFPSITNTTDLLITLTLNSVAEGLYTMSLNGSGAANNTWYFNLQVGALWSGAGLPGNTNWSNGGNWAGGAAPGSGDDVIIAQSGATNAVLTNLIADTSTTIASLRFAPTNSTTKFHTLLINPGVTLSVTGTKGFGMMKDTLNSQVSSGGMTVTIAGTNGTLLVTNEAANIVSLLDNNQASTLDLSALGNFVADVSQIGLGDYLFWPFYRNLNDTNGYGGTPRQFIPTVNLARTNVIKAIYADPYNYTNSDSRGYSLSFLNTELSGTSTTPNFNLGISNIFYLDSINFVGGNSRGNVQFNAAFTSNSPIAIFRGTNGGRMSVFSISDGGGTNTANSNIKSTIDFGVNHGTLDLLCDRFYIGRDRKLIVLGGTPNYQGFFNMGNGIVDANTVVLGFREHAPQLGSNYAFNGYCEGRVIVFSNGTFRVNNTLTLGYTVESDPNGLGSGGNTEWGQVTIMNGGTLIANQVNVGGPVYNASKNNFIVISNNSTMIISNTVASTNQMLDSLTFNNSKLVFNLDGTNTSAYVYTTNLTTLGSNTIQIASIKHLGAISGPIPLIQFGAGNGSFQGLVMPAGVGGALLTTNNVGIYLSIITNTPKNLVWRGYQSADWDFATANWLDLNTGLHTNFANGDFVVFDDASVPTTVHLAGTIDLIPGGVAVTNNANYYIIDNASGGDIQGGAAWAKYGTNTLEIDGPTTLAYQVNQGTLVGNASGGIGSATVAAGASMDFSGTVGNGITSAGAARVSGTGAGNLVVLTGGVITNAGTFNGSFSLQTNSLLINVGSIGTSSTFNSVGNPIVGVGGTFFNAGDIHALTLTVNGTLEDTGAGTIYMYGDTPTGTRGLTISSGGVFIPGGNGIGATTVQAEGASPNNFPGRTLFSSGSMSVFKVDPGVPANSMLLTVYMGWGPNESAAAYNGGTLLITNVGLTPFAAGQSFTLVQNSVLPGSAAFDAGLNTTNAYPVILPASPGPGLGWDLSRVIHQGILGITSVNTNPIILNALNSNISIINTNGAGSTNSAILTEFQWPADHVGWRLQQQVNPITVGLSTNWTTVFGSTFTNDMILTNLIGTNCTFYRLTFP